MAVDKFEKTFYIYTVHIIYAIILTQTFAISEKVFIPLSNIDKNFTPLLLVGNTFAILTVQFILIPGWIGYTYAINKKPHSEKFGNLRFLIDLIITFVTYYMVQLTDKDNFLKSYNELFLWVLPTLFFLFVIWDKLQSMEYANDSSEDRNIEDNQRTKTWICFGFTIAQLIGFVVLSHVLTTFKLPIEYIYLIFTSISLLINIFYRLKRYDVKREKVA